MIEFDKIIKILVLSFYLSPKLSYNGQKVTLKFPNSFLLHHKHPKEGCRFFVLNHYIYFPLISHTSMLLSYKFHLVLSHLDQEIQGYKAGMKFCTRLEGLIYS